MALFSPWGNQQFFDDNGNPATGWKIETYTAGSSTPLATFTTADESVAQSNPIIINSLGFPSVGQIWLRAGLAYKLVLTTATGVIKKTADGITGVTGAASVSQWQASGVTPTFISATSFTLAGDQTSAFHVGRRLQSTTTAGTITSTITASAFTTLTTVTVANDSGVLDSGLSAVNYALLSAINPSVPSTYAKSGANADITSLSVITSVNGGAIGGRRNPIINGGMQVANGRPATLTASPQYGPVDMMLQAVASATGISGTLTQEQNDNWVSGYCAVISLASWTNGQVQHYHRITKKNASHLNGKTITISAKVTQDTGAARMFAFALRKANTLNNFTAVTAINPGFGGASVPSGIVTLITGTVTLAALDAANGLEVVIFDTTNNTVAIKNYYFGDFQIDVGTVATQFVPQSFQTEELACLHHFQPVFTGVGRFTAATNAQLTGTFVTPMHSTPTVTFVSGSVGETGVANRAASAATLIGASRYGGTIQYTTAAATAGNGATSLSDLITSLDARL